MRGIRTQEDCYLVFYFSGDLRQPAHEGRDQHSIPILGMLAVPRSALHRQNRFREPFLECSTRIATTTRHEFGRSRDLGIEGRRPSMNDVRRTIFADNSNRSGWSRRGNPLSAARPSVRVSSCMSRSRWSGRLAFGSGRWSLAPWGLLRWCRCGWSIPGVEFG